jgi:hypothetical protein
MITAAIKGRLLLPIQNYGIRQKKNSCLSVGVGHLYAPFILVSQYIFNRE